VRPAPACLLLLAACAAPVSLEEGRAALSRGQGDRALRRFDATLEELAGRVESPHYRDALVGRGLALIDVAMEQQRSVELWVDVRDTLGQARDALEKAETLTFTGTGVDRGMRDADDEVAPIVAGLDLVEALRAWQDALEGAADAPALHRLFGLVEPHLEVAPSAAVLLVELLYGDDSVDDATWGARSERASEVLADALERWPGHARLHRAVRERADMLAAPERVLAALEPLAQAPEREQADDDVPVPDATSRAAATVTSAYLHDGLGADAYYEEGEPAETLPRAAEHYARAARGYLAGRGDDALLGPDQIDLRRADSFVAAGWCHYYLEDLEEAETAFTRALEVVPGHERAIEGIDYVGDLHYANDIADARDFFGRVAERFDETSPRAEWWNNYAFFCRETGLYEESFAAYERCIELAPDNARWVNDTGLILLYHLARDLDRAEALFRRAWELGREVCENPFVEQDVYDENFLAYTDAMLNLSRLELVRGNLDEARDLVDELLEIAPDRVDARMLEQEIRAAREGRPEPES